MYEVRQFRRDDIDAVVALHLRTWKATYRGILPDARYDEVGESLFARRWATATVWLDTPLHSAFVAQDESDLIGSVCVSPAEDGYADVAEISSLNTVSERQGEGVGSALVAASIMAARDAGFSAMGLWVVENHWDARQFYEARGWRPTGERAELSGAGWQGGEVRYQLQL